MLGGTSPERAERVRPFPNERSEFGPSRNERSEFRPLPARKRRPFPVRSTGPSRREAPAEGAYTRRSRSAAALSVSSFFAKQKRSTGPPPSWYRNALQGIEATPCSLISRIAMSVSLSAAIAE
jgi:hypothetical protein